MKKMMMQMVEREVEVCKRCETAPATYLYLCEVHDLPDNYEPGEPHEMGGQVKEELVLCHTCLKVINSAKRRRKRKRQVAEPPPGDELPVIGVCSLWGDIHQAYMGLDDNRKRHIRDQFKFRLITDVQQWYESDAMELKQALADAPKLVPATA